MAKDATSPVSLVEGKKERKARTPSGPKTVFALVQVLDEQGQPMELPKARVHVISFERDPAVVLDKIESGHHKHALYLRGTISPGR